MSDNTSAAPEPDERSKQLLLDLKVYGTFRSYVEHEDDLINNRMSWMLTIHGFLYATYGFTLQKKLEVFEKINAASRDASKTALNAYFSANNFWYVLFQVEVVLALITFVGMVISLSTLTSIKAAEQANRNLRYMLEQHFPPQGYNRSKQTVVSAAIILAIFNKFQQRVAQRKMRRKYIAKVVRLGTPTGHSLLIPAIGGGGNDLVAKRGILGTLAIPRCMLISWILAFIVQVGYLSISSHIYLDHLLNFLRRWGLPA